MEHWYWMKQNWSFLGDGGAKQTPSMGIESGTAQMLPLTTTFNILRGLSVQTEATDEVNPGRDSY